MIEVRNIYKNYHQNNALNNISITIEMGSVFGLVGTNGAGKTSLLKIIAGIIIPDGGSVLWNDETIFDNYKLKQKLAFVPDELYFFPNYSLIDMAKFYESLYPKWDNNFFIAWHKQSNLPMNKAIRSFSKGMKRAAAIGLALSQRPEFLILDEPFEGLDPIVRKSIKDIIIKSAALHETTILISSHYFSGLENICDHIAMLEQGKLRLSEGLDDLKACYHKIQVAFPQEIPETFHPKGCIFSERRGSLAMMIMRGPLEKVKSEIDRHNPAILEIIPLTIEEIFIYELGGQ